MPAPGEPAARAPGARTSPGTGEWVQVPPHPLLRPGVRFYRGFRMDAGRPRKRLELPIGKTTLVLGFDQRLTVGPAGEPARGGPARTFSSLFSGMRTKAVFGEHPGSVHGIEVVMQPWAVYAMFGIAQSDVAERFVDPLDFAGGRLRRLTDRLAETPDWATRFEVLDAAFLRWQAAGRGASARVLHAWELMASSAGTLPVADLAANVDWSERQLERCFREQIGLAPKALSRVLRLQHAVKLLVAGRPLAETADRAGFYDQSHLNRELRAATGMTPVAFVERAVAAPAEVTRVRGTVTSLVMES